MKLNTLPNVGDAKVERELRQHATAHNLLEDKLADGDKGDISVSSSGTAWTIDNDVVTYGKMQNVSATSRILGRKNSGAGDVEECTLSEVLDFVGSAAQGDILYRGASGWVRLAAGTSGYFLKTQGAGANPVWDVAGSGYSGPSFSAYHNTTQALGSGLQKVSFNSEDWDTASCYDTSTSKFTPNVAGKYLVTAGVGYSASVSGNNYVAVYKNGSLHRRGAQTDTGAAMFGFSVSVHVDMNGSTDYLEIYALLSAGRTARADDGTYFQASLIR